MGSKRGAANLARFNQERSAHTEPLLVHELQLCRKRKLEFKTIGLLAAYLSDRLKVHRTTLLRNIKYKALLIEHLAGQPGAASRAPDSTQDPNILRVKLTAARAEASNLREDLKRATARLERLERGWTEGAGKIDVDYANLAMVLVQLISRFDEFLALNMGKRELVDLSAKPSNRVIAGPERLSVFVSWLEQNQGLPLLANLMRPSGKRK